MTTMLPQPVLNSQTDETIVRFHLSLNVSNLARSIAFYRVLLDTSPAKVRDDYAKFELTEPPLVLSLIPGAHAGGGALNHVGIRLTDAERLVAAQARLEMAGFATQREEGVACCYARQTKFWVTDPDRTLWELYILHDDADVEHAGYHQHDSTAAACGPSSCAPAACAPAGLVNLSMAPSAVWFHNLTQPLPTVIDAADESYDEVQLQGTLNVPQNPLALSALLAEVRRILKTNGRVLVHGLVTDVALTETPNLPGPAAPVKHVPLAAWPLELLTAAGFVDVHDERAGMKGCFTVGVASLRESKVYGRKA